MFDDDLLLNWGEEGRWNEWDLGGEGTAFRRSMRVMQRHWIGRSIELL